MSLGSNWCEPSHRHPSRPLGYIEAIKITIIDIANFIYYSSTILLLNGRNAGCVIALLFLLFNCSISYYICIFRSFSHSISRMMLSIPLPFSFPASPLVVITCHCCRWYEQTRWVRLLLHCSAVISDIDPAIESFRKITEYTAAVFLLSKLLLSLSKLLVD